ncbi:hypothetical protein QUF88_18575 [Bacillus sp. DX1.1]|uniref:hypothetical protein n=1 Tax=unclassified Bacillus (in: firmicutes) TaxID=185979 RepID=UPI0025706D09|nr:MULTISPECIES: hypothetical protein [unclassified Bacillus (in: firmicutes)]MDM5155721.1 hypothetical protein [Bacillus sp. DX1.1]WJE80022.1 hypothetical protein QRE67_16105 [Bacillus sp. DX3.1]
MNGKDHKICHFQNQTFETLSVEMVIRLLPLGLDYKVKMSAFHPHSGKEIDVQIFIIGKEKACKGE